MKKQLSLTLAVLCCLIINDLFSQESWHLFKDASPLPDPIQIEQGSDGALYLLTSMQQIYVKPDQTSPWEKIPGVQPFWNPKVIKVHPQTNRLFVGTGSQGLKYSDDLGETWQSEDFFTNPNTGFHANISSISFNQDSTDIFLGGIFNFDESIPQIAKSSNGGDSWIEIETPNVLRNLTFLSEDHLIASASFIFDFDNPNTIYESIDGGDTWESLSFHYGWISDIITDGSGVVYASCDENFEGESLGVYRSFDLGVSWELISEGIEDNIVYSLETDQEVVLCGTNKGVFELDGTEWLNLNNTLSPSVTQDVRILGNELYLCNELYSVRFSDTNGLNWISLNEGFTGEVTKISPGNSNDIWASSRVRNVISSISVSEEEWSNYNMTESSTEMNRFKGIFKSNTGIYTLGNKELFFSDNNGDSFQNITPFEIEDPVPHLAERFTNGFVNEQGEILLRQQTESKIFRSSDNENWNLLFEDPAAMEWFEVDFTVTNNGAYAVMVFDFTLSYKLYVSLDGENFIDVPVEDLETSSSVIEFGVEALGETILINYEGQLHSLDLNDFTIETLECPWCTSPNIEIDFSTSENSKIIVSINDNGVLEDNGVYVSEDSGVSWSFLSGPDNDVTSAITFSPIFGIEGRPFVISGQSIGFDDQIYYYGDADDVLTLSDSGPSDSDLIVFPNPVRIGESITIKGNVSSLEVLQCMDQNGRIVPIQNEQFGSDLVIRTSSLSSGLYLVQLQKSNGLFETLKFEVIR